MLDLPTSVRLAHCLGASWSDVRGGDDWAPTLLPDYVRKRLEAIEDAAERRLSRPFEGARIRVAGPTQLFGELVAGGALKSAAAARAFADDTWRTYRSYLLAHLQRVRAEVAELRSEITSDLKHAGRRGARLEEFDAAVRAATNPNVLELYDRLVTAMEGPFIEALVGATGALVEPTDPSSIEPWFAERGLLGSQITVTRELTRSLLAREGRILVALVDAAFEEREM
jgi:hypothetical protein